MLSFLLILLPFLTPLPPFFVCPHNGKLPEACQEAFFFLAIQKETSLLFHQSNGPSLFPDFFAERFFTFK